MDRVRELAEAAPFEIDFAVRLPGTALDVKTSEGSLPLASVFKVPLAQVVMERLHLEEMVELREDVRTLWGPLEWVRPGAVLSVRDYLKQMLIHSDNTSTQVLQRMVGLDAVDRWLADRGIEGFDTWRPYRELVLMQLGFGSDWRPLPTMGERLERWQSLDPAEQRAAMQRLNDETERLTLEEVRVVAQRVYQQARDDEAVVAFDRVTDEQGTARGMVEILEGMDPLLLQVMTHCESRGRLPAGLPDGTWCANKTGTVAGSVNDVAVFKLPDGKLAFVALLIAGVPMERIGEAEELHRELSRRIWAAASA